MSFDDLTHLALIFEECVSRSPPATSWLWEVHINFAATIEMSSALSSAQLKVQVYNLDASIFFMCLGLLLSGTIPQHSVQRETQQPGQVLR